MESWCVVFDVFLVVVLSKIQIETLNVLAHLEEVFVPEVFEFHFEVFHVVVSEFRHAIIDDSESLCRSLVDVLENDCRYFFHSEFFSCDESCVSCYDHLVLVCHDRIGESKLFNAVHKSVYLVFRVLLVIKFVWYQLVSLAELYFHCVFHIGKIMR